MKNTCLKLIAVGALSLGLCACKAATQNIPVSSNPDGAIVYADGTQICETPCNVELEKTQAHILTIKKEGYKQADVQIQRKYDTGKVTRDAVQSGTWQSSNGASTEAAISNALLSASADEESGDAYVLTPASVVVELAPKGQPKVAQGPAPITISADQLAPEDQKKLKQDESTSSGPVTISSDQLAPQDQQTVIKTTEPATMQSAVEENPGKAAEELLEAGAAAAPTIHAGKEWKTGGHTSESFNSDGSYTKSSSSTHVGVGVSVNPVEAGLGVLHLLEDAEKKKDESQETSAE